MFPRHVAGRFAVVFQLIVAGALPGFVFKGGVEDAADLGRGASASVCVEQPQISMPMIRPPAPSFPATASLGFNKSMLQPKSDRFYLGV